ncbi:uncharacterized protein LOC128305682 [Anopheles moucheti]|uniref:uncharacterized protein LOC128305682 n=1 Tax=Anopheles moucheti TaxID=186751 RepID=UPI0022F043FB|nr:uncharacterized protein LOC128305682 [Anopheles moucheti]
MDYVEDDASALEYAEDDGVAGFNSLDGCLRCTTKGKRINGRVAFSESRAPDRTDKEFRMRTYGNHHKEDSPLIHLINFDIIQQVTVADPLHLIDLGLTKRQLIGWMFGNFGVKKKLTSSQINTLSTKLTNIKLPVEIHRKFRSLLEIKRWKGSEFASFLHYGSLVVLKDSIVDDQYSHFMLFFCSLTLFSSGIYKQNWVVANTLLKLFVKQYSNIYGPEYVSSNVHNLLHINEEVEQFGPLNTISSYPFENELQRLKRLLRSGRKSLEQVINRISERDAYYTPQVSEQARYPSIHQRGNTITLHIRKDFCLKNEQSNKWFLTKSGYI